MWERHSLIQARASKSLALNQTFEDVIAGDIGVRSYE
jgi:hypothetical protein